MSEAHSTAGPIIDVEAQARAEQVRMLFDRSRASNWVGAPFALLIGWVLWGSVPAGLVVGWVLAKCAVTALRAWIDAGHERADPGKAAVWGRRLEWALAADGAVFGLLGTLVLPSHDEALEAVMIATILGIASIALVVLSMSLRASLAFSLPLLVPPMIHQFTHATVVSVYVGMGMATFLGLVFVEGRRAEEHTLAMLRLRFRMDDVTAQLRQALDAARRSSMAKSRFLATMSHEMRTPLHGILGIARLLRAEPVAESQTDRKARLETLEQTGQHLLGVINDVLDYSRIESGHLVFADEPFDLAALPQTLVEMTEVPAAEKGLALQLDSALTSPCWVRGDATRLRQVLVNLIGNAIKFTDQGHVRIGLRRETDGLTCFDVADTGPGIPAWQREAVFEAFIQADNSFARRHGGTGLGLTISRELARGMGGRLTCLDAPDGGALFRLELMLRSAPAPQRAHASAATVRPLRGHVLVVEDNPVNAIVADAMLRRLGVDVTVVSDGEAAVDAMRRVAVDLVLMDWQMPGIDGFEATMRIRAWERSEGRRPSRIVALTANALEGDRERSLAAGMDDHLSKPFTEEDLRRLLQRHLAA